MMSGLNLEPEDICKEKFKPWFEAGGWIVQDFTQPETRRTQIPKILKNLKKLGASDEIIDSVKSSFYGYAKSIMFPHDGEATRGAFMFCFDYKFHKITRYGIGVAKKDYDKYWSWHKPWFYLLIYAADRQMRYTHQLRDPIRAGYNVTTYGGYEYYNIEPACTPAGKLPGIPVKIPSELSALESIAWNISINRWAKNNFQGTYEPTNEDLNVALDLLNLRSHRPMGLMLRQIPNPLQGALLKKWRLRLSENQRYK
jgi:hypothetical protein